MQVSLSSPYQRAQEVELSQFVQLIKAPKGVKLKLKNSAHLWKTCPLLYYSNVDFRILTARSTTRFISYTYNHKQLSINCIINGNCSRTLKIGYLMSSCFWIPRLLIEIPFKSQLDSICESFTIVPTVQRMLLWLLAGFCTGQTVGCKLQHVMDAYRVVVLFPLKNQLSIETMLQYG